MIDLYYPLRSLREGHWFKLICGASFQHLPAIRSLALSYTLAGADCIDVAADPAVLSSVREAMAVAKMLNSDAIARGFGFQALPWLMVSLNDGEDPHFRKAEFNPADCPPDCPRPCEAVCPADAIVFDRVEDGFSGVLDAQCYGCGRCLPICPIHQIYARSYVSSPTAIAPLVLNDVDAVEIHTQVGHFEAFCRLWTAIAPALPNLKLVAISCPDGEGLIEYLWSLYDHMAPLPCALVWQTDGRPMSGDIGGGATRAAINLGQKVLAAGLPGYVQLAGGTNASTVEKLRSRGLLPPLPTALSDVSGSNTRQFAWSASSAISTELTDQHYIAGVAYGSYARTLLSPLLETLDLVMPMIDSPPSTAAWSIQLENNPSLLWQAVERAHSLVSPLKSSARPVASASGVT